MVTWHLEHPGVLSSARCGLSRQRGAVAVVEFVLLLMVFLGLVFAVGEFYRLSLSDQALARASHLAATAAGRNPASCGEAARTAFAGDALAGWLFDRNSDGSIGFVSGTKPDGTSAQEVRIDIHSDDGDISNGVDFAAANCGLPGSWIRVRVAVPVRARFAFGKDVLRQHTSWAVNQG